MGPRSRRSERSRAHCAGGRRPARGRRDVADEGARDRRARRGRPGQAARRRM